MEKTTEKSETTPKIVVHSMERRPQYPLKLGLPSQKFPKVFFALEFLN